MTSSVWLDQRRQRVRLYVGVIVAVAVICLSSGMYAVYVSEKHRAIQELNTEAAVSISIKGKLIERLLSSTGFGGFIHNFKNYVIRGDPSYYDAAVRDYENFETVLESYRELELSEPETEALGSIANTIGEYRENLGEAKRLIDSGAAVNRVDDVVRVDDTEMIEALLLLEEAWQGVLAENEERLAATLAEIKQITLGVHISIAVSLLLGGISVWRIYSLDRRTTSLLSDLTISEIKFREIFENSADGIVTISGNGLIEEFNRKAEELFGYRRSEVIGKNVSMLVPPDERKDHDMYVANSSAYGPRVIDRPRGLEAIKKNGQHFPIELNIAPYKIRRDRKFIGIIRDITERKAAEKALALAAMIAQENSESKTHFLASASHELRTPLNAILGFTDIIRMETFGPIEPQKYREYLDDIQTAGEHLRAIVDNILDLAQIESGQTDLSFNVVSIDKVIDEAVLFLSLDARKRNIEVEITYTSDPPALNCDELRVRQILINTLSNALKHSESGESIRIECGMQDDRNVVILIRDNGEGIPPAMLKKIFEPFVHSNDPMDANKEGTGLGLSISKHLAELHGGNITITSTLGSGTEVRIVLPMSRSTDRTR